MPKPPIAAGPAAARQGDRASGEEPTTSQRQELQIILDSVPAFIWYKDRENRILRANRLAAESMGTTVADLEGRSTYDIYPEEAAEYHRDDLEVIRSGHPKLGILERLKVGSGEQRWIQTDKVPYRDQHGEIIGVIVFSVDVTERVEAETALREARDGLERRVEERTRELAAALDDLRRESGERLRAEERARQQQSQLAHLLRLHTVEGMAAQLAHEINQPLSAVTNYASGLRRWLDKESLDLAAVRWAAEQISQQALRAAEIVRRQRDFVRKVPPRRDPCDVVQVVRDAVHLIEADAREQGVEIRVVLNPGLAPFGIDRIQIEQVVLNLLRNALEAMDEGAEGEREIVAQVGPQDDDYALVKVRDTGRGLPAGGERTLFEAFFTTKKNGLGMGLAISEAIVAAHGGTLWAEANPDRGATFSFTLRRHAGD